MTFENIGNIVFHRSLYTSKKIRKDINLVRKNLDDKIKKGSIVGLLGTRNEQLVCIMLACIENNITFIPIDKDMPVSRIKYMIQDTGAKYLIGQFEQEFLEFSEEINCITYNQLFTENTSQEQSISNIEGKNPAYILYTSGSTGNPKGVMISYEGFMNFLRAIPLIIPFERGKNIACFTSISFDISLLEIVLGLISGMNLILADDEERKNPQSIIHLLDTYGVDLLQITPSMVKMLQIYQNGKLSFLNKVSILMLGGEELTDNLLQTIQKEVSCRIFNMYGPTETTIWSTVSDLTHKEKSDIGKPILNTTLYLVDKANKPVKKGAEGELLIGGKGLACGYVNKTDLTAERFITLDFANGEKVYKTGDICKYDENDCLIYKGRKDNQVKINGHRIELEEIEHCVMEEKKIVDAIACVDDNKIICFFRANEKIDIDALREKMKSFLPVYMIPYRFIQINDFEYTISNKINKKAVIEKYHENQNKNINTLQKEEKGKLNSVAEKIKSAFSDIVELGKEEINLNDKISKFGIDSIQFVSFVVVLEELFEIEFEEEFLNITEFKLLNDVVKYVEERVYTK